MSSKLNLQATLNWCGPFINYQPLMIGGMEPALSIANIILQTMLGPPFCWRWNRETSSFPAVQEFSAWQQDYAVSIPDFGFIEQAWVTSEDGRDKKELEIKTSLSATMEPGRPKFIAAQGDDGAGNITFRLMPVPGEGYTIHVMYQKKPPLMTSLASKWAPVPDEYGYIYQWGVLALASMLSNDPRFPLFNQKFTSHLLGAQDGLDEMQRNIFLGNWLSISKEVTRASAKPGQGMAARQQ